MSDALHTTCHGIGVGAGAAVGPLVVVTPPPQAPADERGTTDAAAASAIVRGVFEDVAKGMGARARVASDRANPILEAGALIAPTSKGSSSATPPPGT